LSFTASVCPRCLLGLADAETIARFDSDPAVFQNGSLDVVSADLSCGH
jgi:hypothetical protein